MESNWNNKTILLVEDDQTSALLVEELLLTTGIQIVHVVTGKECLEILDSKEYVFDLILMDIRLPDIDGIETTRRIRLTNEKVPIIYMTAAVSETNKSECFNAGGNEFISKPFAVGNFFVLLTKYLNIPVADFFYARAHSNTLV
ncbi:MAG: response regulator [Bacteroidales bacterium]|nr:response regulator [Bacteroidales bacterium]